MSADKTKKSRVRSATTATRNRQKGFTRRLSQSSLGSLSHKMKDHLYFLSNGYIYTTPRMTCKMNMKFYAAILVTADRKSFSVQIGKDEQRCNAFVMRPGSKFVFSADDIEHVSVFVEPKHPSFGYFQTIPATGLVLDRSLFETLDQSISDAYQGRFSREQALRFFEQSVAIACSQLPPWPKLDTRISKITTILLQEDKASLADLAREVGLSSFRLSHIFAESLGITLRQFLQWKKVNATALPLAVRSITQAAHDVGFADSAHLSHTFQDLFGVPPSYIADNKYVQRFFYK